MALEVGFAFMEWNTNGSPDVGDAKWNAIPMEQASQIEIIKGAHLFYMEVGLLMELFLYKKDNLNQRESFGLSFSRNVWHTIKARTSLVDQNPRFSFDGCLLWKDE